MMQTAQMLLSELVDKVSKCSKNRLEMQMVGADVAVSRFMSPAEAGEGDMSFLTDPRYAEAMKATKAAAIVLRERDAKALFGEELPNRTMLLCDDPYAFFAFASQIFYPVKRTPGIHPRAYVEESALVDPTASIEPMAVVQAGAKVGANTLISAGAYIGEDCDIGRDCVIYPNAVLQAGTVVGDGSVVQPGAVLGGDGFGFAPFKGEWIKIPQRGRTVLGADVEIGANTTIDRGAIDDTFVGEGTKLDNQIQLGHNVRVGKYCVMASCVGIAGSTTVGDHVMVGGAAMINGHIEIPSGSAVGPATAITGWGKEPKQLTGFFPALTKRGGADCAASRDARRAQKSAKTGRAARRANPKGRSGGALKERQLQALFWPRRGNALVMWYFPAGSALSFPNLFIYRPARKRIHAEELEHSGHHGDAPASFSVPADRPGG